MGAIGPWKSGFFFYLLSSTVVGQGLPDKKLSIVVYDAGAVGPKTLDRTERLAAAIFSASGLQSSWRAASKADSEILRTDFTARPTSECLTVPIPAILRVKIFRRAPAGLPARALGFSLPCAREGVQVAIYADRVANLSETGGPTFCRVLAYAIAHELGHVLLHSVRHENTGLMKGVWSKSDWQRAAVSIVSFSPGEMHQITEFLAKASNSQPAQVASLKNY
jgi:hypothetical protein